MVNLLDSEDSRILQMKLEKMNSFNLYGDLFFCKKGIVLISKESFYVPYESFDNIVIYSHRGFMRVIFKMTNRWIAFFKYQYTYHQKACRILKENELKDTCYHYDKKFIKVSYASLGAIGDEEAKQYKHFKKMGSLNDIYSYFESGKVNGVGGK